MPDRLKSFQEVLTEAVADMADKGFDSAERVAKWTRVLREAAERSMIAPASLESQLREWLASTYARMVDKGAIFKRHPSISRYTVERIKPHLRSELDRRIMASANLIKLNRQEAIETTLRRFQGWATAIPVGGVPIPKKREAKADIRKAMGSLPFQERRVLIDQGHKLIAAINDIVSKDAGAIAARWHSNWRQPGYDYREDHKERDQEVWLIRDSWAQQKGLVRKGKNGYADEIDQPGTAVFCRCSWHYIYNLRDLPADMLTAKGRNALAGARDRVMAGLADSEETVPAGLNDESEVVPHHSGDARNANLERRRVLERAGPKLASPIPIPVDRDHDVSFMFVIAKDASRLYADRSLPRELTLKGKTFDPAELGFAHELAELKYIVRLVRAFIADCGREPNEHERVEIYKRGHIHAGVPAERAKAKEMGVDWDAWEAWSRGKLQALEHKKVRNPVPNAHVRPAPHCRQWPMENIDAKSVAA